MHILIYCSVLMAPQPFPFTATIPTLAFVRQRNDEFTSGASATPTTAAEERHLVPN